VRMVRDMDMRVVAEGVETREQFDYLKEMNCDYMQGYYFSKPMPAEAFKQKYLTRH
jgi:EAL domain-containing protein (putative c-di-GMP-specific phosphodiesterase class I)